MSDDKEYDEHRPGHDVMCNRTMSSEQEGGFKPHDGLVRLAGTQWRMVGGNDAKRVDVRCERCGALMAKVDETGLTVRRNDLQILVGGAFHMALVCYRPCCRCLNVFEITTQRKWIQSRTK